MKTSGPWPAGPWIDDVVTDLVERDLLHRDGDALLLTELLGEGLDHGATGVVGPDHEVGVGTDGRGLLLLALLGRLLGFLLFLGLLLGLLGLFLDLGSSTGSSASPPQAASTRAATGRWRSTCGTASS
jgi:hypothetical protein